MIKFGCCSIRNCESLRKLFVRYDGKKRLAKELYRVHVEYTFISNLIVRD